jgi:hypothetical protein
MNESLGGKINTGPDLSRAVMPLIKILRGARLSWSDREEIAAAIHEAWRAHRSMEEEACKLSQMGLQQQMAYQSGVSQAGGQNQMMRKQTP